MCGKLFCDKGQTNPIYGRFVTFNTCKATFYSDSTRDFGQVDTGTKCGEGKVRSHSEHEDQVLQMNLNLSLEESLSGV